MTQTKVGIFFGGKSAEHEVSINSARNVLEALDTTRYEAVLIGISKDGRWHTVQPAELLSKPVPQTILDAPEIAQFTVTGIDVALPILHGPMGEDGTMQGFFELAGLPYVGPGVLASATGMDKDVMKRLMRDAGISIAPFRVVLSSERPQLDTNNILEELGNEVFVKPANMGSSVGVNRATNVSELTAALDEAFKFDTKVLVEQAIHGHEIECAVLGNEQPKTSVLGRVVPTADFYSYAAKYVDDDGAVLEIPANLPDSVSEKARALAVRTFTVLGCEGLTRVDMFVTPADEIIVNEINTIPGFTKISMYPKLWEVTGLPYSDLITKLIELAFERFERRRSIQTAP